jgi:periplasmic divalent cation tolerance protein
MTRRERATRPWTPPPGRRSGARDPGAYLTAPDAAEANRIGKILVSERLAACANVIPGMESHYWWKGKVESSRETVLILKLAASLREPLLRRALELHPAETPCVVFLPIAGGNPAFLEWIADETES